MRHANVSGLLGVAVLVLSAGGCGEIDDPTETKTGAIINQWNPWFSEEGVYGTGYKNCYPGSDGTAVSGVGCSGSYCDNIRLYCERPPAGFTESTGAIYAVYGYISEEAPNNYKYCPNGSILWGMDATGSYSDNIAITCKAMNFPTQGVSCKWSPWVSDEQGTLYFDPEPARPGRGVAIGVSCSGSYCDNMQFLVCEPQCRTSADCGVYACVNGSCVVG
jgi:hypothetical protein